MKEMTEQDKSNQSAQRNEKSQYRLEQGVKATPISRCHKTPLGWEKKRSNVMKQKRKRAKRRADQD
jgi:hypothetical protein